MSEGQGDQWTGSLGTFGRYHLPGGITVGYCIRHRQAWQVRNNVDLVGCVTCEGERNDAGIWRSDTRKQLHFHRTVPHQGPALSPILRDILDKEYRVSERASPTVIGEPTLDFLRGLRAAGVPDVEILLGVIEQDGEVAISVK